MVKTVIAWTMLSLLVVGCAGTTSRSPGRDIGDYVNVKREYAKAIMQASPETFSSQNKLVPIPPLTVPYSIGSVLLKETGEPLTDSCVLSTSQLPASLPLTSVPEMTSQSTFMIDLGVPKLLAEAINHVVDFKTYLKNSGRASLRLFELSGINVARDNLDKAMARPACHNVLEGREVIVVRGVITGKERITSTKALSGSVKTKILDKDAVEIKYDTNGGYEVSNIKAEPKFWIVSERHYKERERGPLAYEEVTPSDATVDMLYGTISKRLQSN